MYNLTNGGCCLWQKDFYGCDIWGFSFCSKFHLNSFCSFMKEHNRHLLMNFMQNSLSAMKTDMTNTYAYQ